MNSVPWFQHRAITREDRVEGGGLRVEGLFAQRAWCLRVQHWHFSGVLLALGKGEGVIASRCQGVGVFEGIADTEAVDGEVTVSVLTSD